METNNTRKNTNKNIKHKNQTTLLTNITQKHQKCKENSFFIDWKQNKKKDKNKNTTPPPRKKKKANIETERLNHTPWKQKQEQQKKTIKSQKWKQLGFQKGDIRKVCFK